MRTIRSTKTTRDKPTKAQSRAVQLPPVAQLASPRESLEKRRMQLPQRRMPQLVLLVVRRMLLLVRLAV